MITMEDTPIFSVIIPTYNREKILGRAIDSILAQTFDNFELIIVDDGSKDQTKKLVNSYRDERVKYIYKENGGQNSALNRGLKEARGCYIAFCDSDDAWLPTKLEKTYEKYMQDEEIGVVYCWTGVNRNGKIELARNDFLEGHIYKEVLTQGYLTSPTFLSCKKSCFETIGEFDLKVINCQDDDFCFNLCRYFKVALIKEILGVYYSDVDDRKSSMKKTAADSYLFLWEKHKEEVLQICGKEVLGDRYFKASMKYLMIKERKKAKEVYQWALDNRKITLSDRIRWRWAYIVSLI